MSKEKIDEKLNDVSGGLIFNASNIAGSDPLRPWEVIDNFNGNVLGRFCSEADARAFAASYGPDPYNTMETDWASVLNLRYNPICV